MAMNCSELLSLASSMIDNRDSAEEIVKVLEKARELFLSGVDKIKKGQYFWFCYHYGFYCMEIGKLKEAEYYLKKTIDRALKLEAYFFVTESVAYLLYVLRMENRIMEAISIGEKYVGICSGIDGVDLIKVGLCYLYDYRGWNRKAQKMADELLNNSNGTDSDYPSILYKCSYNNGKCKNREEKIAEWYNYECLKYGRTSGSAMAVLAEKAMVMALKDERRAGEAIMMLEEAIPVLEESGLEYNLTSLSQLYSFQAELKMIVGDKVAALDLFSKSRSLINEPEMADPKYLRYIDKAIAELKEWQSSAEKNSFKGKKT